MALSKPTETRRFQLFGNTTSAILLSLALCIIMTYALSAFIYFTVLIIESTGDDVFYVQGVAVQNITYALAALVTTYAFIRLLDHKIRRTPLKYLTIAVVNFLVIFNISYVFYLLYWSKMPDYKEDGSITVSYLYSIIPSIVGMAFYYFWTKSKAIS